MEAISEKIRYSLSYRIRDKASSSLGVPVSQVSKIVVDKRLAHRSITILPHAVTTHHLYFGLVFFK